MRYSLEAIDKQGKTNKSLVRFLIISIFFSFVVIVPAKTNAIRVLAVLYDLWALIFAIVIHQKTKRAYKLVQEGRWDIAFLTMGCKNDMSLEQRVAYYDKAINKGTSISVKPDTKDLMADNEHMLSRPIETTEISLGQSTSNTTKKMRMIEIQCKNCGSVEMKKLRNNMYSCQYCGTRYQFEQE